MTQRLSVSGERLRYTACVIGWDSNFSAIGEAIKVGEFLSSHGKIEKQ